LATRLILVQLFLVRVQVPQQVDLHPNIGSAKRARLSSSTVSSLFSGRSPQSD
jgi:hypothetical protein